MRHGSTSARRCKPGPNLQAATSDGSKGMRRRYRHYDYYGRWNRAPRRHEYGPSRRRGLFPVRGAVMVLLALAVLVVLASLT